MQTQKPAIAIKLVALAALWLPLLAANPQATQPDNTKNNRADRATSAPSADQAKNNRSDRETMKLIRRAITSDKSLSTEAHNVKVISDHGKVTLRGPVHSEDERKTIEADALRVAGDGNVDNQLTVKSDSADRTKSEEPKR